MMTYPGGVFHCSLGLMGEGSQPRYVCVCVRLPTVYDGVFTPGPVLCCCDAECHPAPAWAPQPEKPAVKLTGLSSALTYTLSSLADTHAHTHTCNHIHIMRHTRRHTHSSMAWGLSTHAHTSPPTPPPPPPHPHISRDHHTSCRQSLSCQLQTQCKRNMLTELGYMVATHNLNTFLQFDGNQQKI